MLSLMIVAALTASSDPASPDAAPVVAAERAFAADGLAMGIGASFTRWSLPDAVVIAGGRARTVREVYPPEAPRDPEEPVLKWWPNFAGVARSGELGFTTGGVDMGGRKASHYVTVWARQPDGGWKWVYDGGSGASSADAPGPDSEPVILPTATVAAVDAASAWKGVEAAEASLALAAATDQAAAHQSWLAEEARLYVAPRAPGIGREAFAATLAGWPATFEFGAREGGGMSAAGDLAWTYGPAAWTRDGQTRRGHYMRIWQRQAGPDGDRWRIVLAQLIAAPPPAPPAGA